MASRNEELLAALLSGGAADIVPQSRNEELLLALINGEKPTGEPQSRMEALLLALCEKGMGGGGDRPNTGIEILEYMPYYPKVAARIKVYSADGEIPPYMCYCGVAGGEPRLYSDTHTIEFADWDEITQISQGAFSSCIKLILTELPPNLTTLRSKCFNGCSLISFSEIPKTVELLESKCFSWCTSLTEIKFEGRPTRIDSDVFSNCANLLTINVPWAEGEVSGAPWGATNATINYNYTGG